MIVNAIHPVLGMSAHDLQGTRPNAFEALECAINEHVGQMLGEDCPHGELHAAASAIHHACAARTGWANLQRRLKVEGELFYAPEYEAQNASATAETMKAVLAHTRQAIAFAGKAAMTVPAAGLLASLETAVASLAEAASPCAK